MGILSMGILIEICKGSSDDCNGVCKNAAAFVLCHVVMLSTYLAQDSRTSGGGGGHSSPSGQLQKRSQRFAPGNAASSAATLWQDASDS